MEDSDWSMEYNSGGPVACIQYTGGQPALCYGVKPTLHSTALQYTAHSTLINSHIILFTVAYTIHRVFSVQCSVYREQFTFTE